jgi:bifunctional DNA-binding transcriptional regulator/antitoxin component of YhaV-PrlF toxin-antitoxin module
MAIIRKLQKTKKDQYTLTIPKTLVELLGLKEQDVIEFKLRGNEIILKKSEDEFVQLRKKRGGKQ